MLFLTTLFVRIAICVFLWIRFNKHSSRSFSGYTRLNIIILNKWPRAQEASNTYDRQYNTIQYNTIQYNTIQYNTIQYNTIQYNTIQYNTIQYNTIQYNTIQYNTIQYNTIQYNTIQ